MKQSLFVVMMFVVGCVVGAWFELDWELHDVSMYILYVLMFQVGISVGCSDNLKAVLSHCRPKMLLLPLATVTGTLIFAALISFVLARWNVFDCMAVGSGLGYYSLSSILITQLKMDTLGEQLATELGAIALLANICRELLALTLAPPPFRSVCTDFGCRSNQHRCGTACHCPLLRQGVCTDSYLPWYVARPECPPHSSVPLRILTNEEPLLLFGEDYSIH